MNKEDFLIQMQDVLQTEVDLTYETVLADLDEWDSLSSMDDMKRILIDFLSQEAK